MLRRRSCFPARKGDPAPLSIIVGRQVRFEEVDPLGIVWHGRYPSYFEDARTAFGSKYGIGYEDFMRHQIMAPIKQMRLDYRLPLRFREEFTVEAILHWSEALRFNYEFIIRNDRRQITTTGSSVQILLDREENLLFVPPPFVQDFRERWRAGELA